MNKSRKTKAERKAIKEQTNDDHYVSFDKSEQVKKKQIRPQESKGVIE
jgi:hypothetical protein